MLLLKKDLRSMTGEILTLSMKSCISSSPFTYCIIFFSLHVTLNIQCRALADCLNKEIDKKQELLICYFLKDLPEKPGK